MSSSLARIHVAAICAAVLSTRFMSYIEEILQKLQNYGGIRLAVVAPPAARTSSRALRKRCGGGCVASPAIASVT